MHHLVSAAAVSLLLDPEQDVINEGLQDTRQTALEDPYENDPSDCATFTDQGYKSYCTRGHPVFNFFLIQFYL